MNKDMAGKNNLEFLRGEYMAKKVGKDDFVKGFVPHHNHGSVDYTSMEAGHVHQCLDVASPPIQTQDGNHIPLYGGICRFRKWAYPPL